MAKQEPHDIREYYIMVARIDVNPAATIAVIPIPFAAQVTSIVSAGESIVDANTAITLEREGLKLQLNGSIQTLSVSSGDAIGTVRRVEFSPIDPANFMLEGEDGDALADAASLEIVSAGQSTIAALYTFMITLRA